MYIYVCLYLFIAGGRLETELRYSASTLGETESIIHLLVTQTAKEATSPEMPQQRLLHKKALLAHLQLLKAATRVTVNLFDSYVLQSVLFTNYYISMLNVQR